MLPSDLPSDLPAFIARFGSDEACREHLFNTRYPTGFRCEACAGTRCYPHTTINVYKCSGCRKQHSLLAGTIFEQTKKGLSQWFLAIFFVTTSKSGMSAAEIEIAVVTAPVPTGASSAEMAHPEGLGGVTP